MASKPTRPRLRAKTGCVGCRKQKKKCDEMKPSCRPCLHYKRECVWPTVFADGRYGKRRASSANVSPSPANSSPPQEILTLATSYLLKQVEETQVSHAIEHYNPQVQIDWYPTDFGEGQEKLLFHHFSTCTLPTAIRRHAHPLYSTYQDVFQFGFERPDIMNVFLGIAALRISQNNKKCAIEATKFYNPSVNAVSRSIRAGEVNGTEEWLLVLIAFMVIFETSRFDLCSNVMLHLGGLAQLFHIRKLNHALPDQQRPFHRIAAEAFVYHLATYSILYSAHDIDGVAQQFDWSDLQGYDEVMPYPEASKLANSPILGLQFDLFKIIFEVTRLSRKTPLKPPNLAMAIGFRNELDLIQQQLTEGLDFEDEDEHESQEIALLYILVTQIFLFKVMNPETSIEHPTIGHILSQALLFVDKCTVYASCNSFFCWPLTILACAVRTEEEKELIQRKMAECHQWTHSGQIHRSSSIINAIWENESSGRSSDVSGTINSARGLDRLLYKEGLVHTLFPLGRIDSG
ncbi:fungal-specific transcription factor domain-containing protein [Rhexocercosporidium sp. MPI-PUGE-AT-0058]|nr:fungal-specific transcription factor domain-containing protein [Rhexocercosporidium sp. MPI-PUGE-AT-0058]